MAATWWSSNYIHRKQITVTNNESTQLDSGYTFSFTLDTASLVSGGKLLSSCNDLRVVYWSGSTNTELSRDIRDPNTSSSRIFWKSQAAIAGSGNSGESYWIYYNYSSAGSPPITMADVYEYYKQFSDMTGWTNSGVTISNSHAILTDAGDYLEYPTGLTANGHTFETRIRWNALGVVRSCCFGVGNGLTSGSGWYCPKWCCSTAYTQKNLLAISSNLEDNTRATLGIGNGTPQVDSNIDSYVTTDTWYEFAFRWGNNSNKIHQNGTERASYTAGNISAASGISIQYTMSGGGAPTDELEVDWALYRKYTPNEPTSSDGPEEGGIGAASRVGYYIRLRRA